MTRPIRELLVATHSRDEELRNAAIAAISLYAADEGVHKRLAELLVSTSLGTASAAAYVLLRSGGASGLEIVLDSLAAVDGDTRNEALYSAIADVRATERMDLFHDAVRYAKRVGSPRLYEVVETLLTEWSRMQYRPYRDVGTQGTVTSGRPLDELVAETFDPDPLVQWVAMDGLGDFGADDLVLQRLGELLDAGVIETFVLAAEILLRRCGIRGLEVVMDELVLRRDDGQIDYIWYKMGEVQATQLQDLYREAYLYAQRVGSPEMQDIVGWLIEAWNGMQNEERTMLRADGTRFSDWGIR